MTDLEAIRAKYRKIKTDWLRDECLRRACQDRRPTIEEKREALQAFEVARALLGDDFVVTVSEALAR